MERWPRRHRLTVHDYHRLSEVGVLAPDARVELIDGEIIDMASLGKDPLSVVDRLTRMLVIAAGDEAIVRVQGSVRLSEIEVSESSLRYDRDVKAPLYARHGIPEAWIFDMEHGQLLVYGAPAGGEYRTHEVVTVPRRMAIAARPSIAIDLAGVL